MRLREAEAEGSADRVSAVVHSKRQVGLRITRPSPACPAIWSPMRAETTREDLRLLSGKQPDTVDEVRGRKTWQA